MKILDAEDYSDPRHLLHLYFTSKSFEVMLANNGLEGLYKMTTEHPDRVLSDLNMPNSRGLKLVEAIRGRQHCSP